ncbi:MAG: DUF1636 family protein [Pseudomonadota bacterium]
MAEAAHIPSHTILICSKCRGTEEAARMRRTLALGVGDDFAFRAVDCMAGCDFPVAVGFQCDAKATYLFGPIENEDDIAALKDFARQYQQSETGWTSAGQRPKALYTKTLARMPAAARETAARSAK